MTLPAPSPRRLRAPLLAFAAALAGAAAGVGGFTFTYARGYSYLTNDPRACANCHIMGEHYAAWLKGSHHAVATCNDCHTPHDPLGKYYVKAKNGFWHSFYFTMGGFPEPLRITPPNRRVTENACRDCHAAVTAAMDGGGHRNADPGASCIRCHAVVGHWVR